MKIAVICANGRVGKKIVEEALRQGLDVTAVAREENQTKAASFLQKNLFALTEEDLAGYDAIVDAFGAWTEETLVQHSTSLERLCDLLKGKKTKLYVVGGAGSLYVNKEHTLTVADGPSFPDAFKPLAKAMKDALTMLRKRKDVNWVYLSPAADFQAEGERKGSYILAGEELTLNAKGESVISYSDYALALIDVLLENKYNQVRISVVGQ